MGVQEALLARRTVRRFAPTPVSGKILTSILNATRRAPSSRNQQPWHFVVVRNRETLEAIDGIAGTGRFIADAPLAIAIAMDGADSPELDAGRALQQMEVMAWSKGLGTCFVTLAGDEPAWIAALLGIPKGMDLITVMPFGYRSADFTGRGVPRKPLSAIAHSETFGNAYGAN